MILASIEQICPDQPDWAQQCEALQSATSLPAMVWVALQMGLWLARSVLETDLSRRASEPCEWPKCPKCDHRFESKGWRSRQITTLVGVID